MFVRNAILFIPASKRLLIPAAALINSVRSTIRVNKLQSIYAGRVRYLFTKRISLKVSIRKRRLNLDAFFIALSFLLSPLAWADNCQLTQADQAKSQTVEVDKVIDGDTIRLSNGELVRFIGVNTPEIDHQFGRSQPFAEHARDYVRSKVRRFKGKLVLVVGDERRDRHGRLLAHVFSPRGQNIQADILRNGFGVWITVPPNLAYLDCYRNNEKQARESKSRVWSEQFRAPLDTKFLSSKNKGFQWIRGKISRIAKGRKNWWLNFEDATPQGKFSKVTLRVRKDDLHYFKEQPLERLLDKVVVVKGWLTQHKKQLVMSLRHPASLQIVSQ